MSKAKVIYYLLLFVAITAMTGCNSTPSSDSPVPRPADSSIAAPQPPTPPSPQPGKASVSGILYTFTGNAPIPGTIFYLTPAKEEDNGPRPPMVLVGPHEDQGDYRGTSGPHGEFTINDIEPGNYYLAVWAPYTWVLAINSPSDFTPRLIQLSPNDQINLGLVYVSWP